jgi:hypothetical protein
MESTTGGSADALLTLNNYYVVIYHWMYSIALVLLENLAHSSTYAAHILMSPGIVSRDRMPRVLRS